MLIDFTLFADEYLKHNQVIELPEKVELFIHPTAHSVGTLTLSLTNGETLKQYKVKNEAIDVSDMFTLPGEVKGSVVLSIRGKIAKTWQIEPFCVRQIDAGIVAIPEIVALKQEVDTLKRALTEINALIQNN